MPCRLGITGALRKPWSAADKARVRSGSEGGESAEELATALDRTPAAVQRLASKLKVSLHRTAARASPLASDAS